LKINVVNVIEEGKLGGPQVRICRVASQLKKNINTIVLMPKQNSIEFKNLCDLNSVEYIDVFLTRITKQFSVLFGYVFLFPFEIINLTYVLKKTKCDIVHVSGGSWQYKGLIAGKLAGKKVVWHLNDSSMPKIILLIFSIFSSYSDAFIFASERTRKYYMPLIRQNKNMFLIPAPVDTDFFNPLNINFAKEDCLSKSHNKLIITTIANINPIKGIENIIKAASIVNKHINNVEFYIIGQISKRQKKYYSFLKTLKNDLKVINIHFVGPREDVREFLKKTDVYLCSSLAESSPMSVWEAMSMGKPIVSTRVGDVPIYVLDGINGFISNIDDYKDLSNNLIKLCLNKELRVQFGKVSRQTAINKLDISICSNKHEQAYKKLYSFFKKE
jgi:glycosyltransferase involved in cell wall biosynthesis